MQELNILFIKTSKSLRTRAYSEKISKNTKLMQHRLIRPLIIRYINIAKNGLGLSYNDISDVFKKFSLPTSTKTYHKYTSNSHLKCKAGRYRNLNPGKSWMGKRLNCLVQWINYVLHTGYDDLPSILQQVEQDIEPP